MPANCVGCQGMVEAATMVERSSGGLTGMGLFMGSRSRLAAHLQTGPTLARRAAQSAAIPDRPDRCLRPARAEAAAIVAAAIKAGPAEIVHVAIIPVITGGRVNVPRTPFASRPTPYPIFLGVKWKGVVQRLLVTRQEAIAMPARSRPLYGPAQPERRRITTTGRWRSIDT